MKVRGQGIAQHAVSPSPSLSGTPPPPPCPGGMAFCQPRPLSPHTNPRRQGFPVAMPPPFIGPALGREPKNSHPLTHDPLRGWGFPEATPRPPHTCIRRGRGYQGAFSIPHLGSGALHQTIPLLACRGCGYQEVPSPPTLGLEGCGSALPHFGSTQGRMQALQQATPPPCCVRDGGGALPSAPLTPPPASQASTRKRGAHTAATTSPSSSRHGARPAAPPSWTATSLLLVPSGTRTASSAGWAGLRDGGGA